MRTPLRPLETPFTPEVEGILAGYPTRDGYLLALFRVFANSVRFLKKGTANLLDRESPLPMRHREIVILRVTANNHCEYEWGVHVAAFAAHVGLNEAQIQATLVPAAAAGIWSAEEALLIAAVDELCARGTLEEPTLRAFEETFTPEEQLEVLALAGNYHTVSFVANVSRLAPEPFAVRFPIRPAAADQGPAAVDQGLPETSTSIR